MTSKAKILYLLAPGVELTGLELVKHSGGQLSRGTAYVDTGAIGEPRGT